MGKKVTQLKTAEQKNVNLTYRECEAILGCLKQLMKVKMNTFLKFDMAENINALEAQQKSINAARDLSDIADITEYQKATKDLFMRYATDGVIKDPEKVNAYKHAEIELQEKYVVVTSEIEKRNKEIDKFMNSESDILTLKKLKRKLFPKELEIDISPIFKLIESE